jgi:hypothetical protein
MIGISEVSIKLSDGTRLKVEPKENEQIFSVEVDVTGFKTTLLVGGKVEKFHIPFGEGS